MGVDLPRWVWVGAVSLACVAGMVNVVGFLGFQHQAITHLTGTTSLLGVALARGETRAAAHLAGMAMAFVAGAALSGLLIQDATLRLGRRYGVALSLEAAMLLAAIPLFQRGSVAGPLLAATACGLQNAMATTYSGAVVRSTQVSGMFTDLGIGLGHALRGLPLPRRRLRLSALIIGGFLGGGIVGAALFDRLGYWALTAPALVTGTTGVAYVVLGIRWRRLPADETPPS